VILLISASWVGWITDESHQCPAGLNFVFPSNSYIESPTLHVVVFRDEAS
jgi:hypothetical protein